MGREDLGFDNGYLMMTGGVLSGRNRLDHRLTRHELKHSSQGRDAARMNSRSGEEYWELLPN